MITTQPIPCSSPTCTHPVSPGGRGIVIDDRTAFHRECLLTAPAPGPLTRRLAARRWESGRRCRVSA